MTAQDLINAAQAAQGIPSDYALAARLGITRAAISSYRVGRSRPDENTTCRLAELAGLDPDECLAFMAAERAASPEIRAAWLRVAARLRAVAAVLVAGILSGFISGGPDAQARASIEEPAAKMSAAAHLRKL